MINSAQEARIRMVDHIEHKCQTELMTCGCVEAAGYMRCLVGPEAIEMITALRNVRNQLGNAVVGMKDGDGIKEVKVRDYLDLDRVIALYEKAVLPNDCN